MPFSRILIAPALFAPLLFVARANAQEAVTVVNDQPPAAQPAPVSQPAPQPAPYVRTTEGTPGEIEEEGSGPKPRVGFQMAARTGYSLPMGSVAGGLGDNKMSNGFGGQVPFIVDIGGKVHKNIFIGGYLNLAIGGCGDYTTTDCASVSFHIGPEIIFSILPGEKVDPWVGYGIGLEAAGVSANNGNSSVSLSGWEFAHLMGGVDFRLTRGFGIGPFLDLSLAEYAHESASVNGVQVVDASIDQKALHEWLTLGVRFTIFP